MRSGPAAAVCLLVLSVACLGAIGCERVLGREYEYEEQIYLATDGSASVVVNSSIAALVALRGLDLDPSPDAAVDRERVRRLYTSPVSTVTRVSRPWRRHGRNFVQVRVDTADVRRLGQLPPFAWSEYGFASTPVEPASDSGRPGAEPLIEYRQKVGEPVRTGADGFGWTGDELVAIRLHLPSKISFHNAPSKRVDRGNIVAWEQPLRARLGGEPIDIQVRMESQSILYRTLAIFGLAMVAALTVLAVAISWVVRRGRRSVGTPAAV
ncbi:MAG: hypothetical protein U0Q12_24130 [Vicinamibacterales bacterium]